METKRLIIAEDLKNNLFSLKNKTATIGIDGFIDTLQKVVLNKVSKNELNYFSSITQLSKYLETKCGISCCLEIHNTVIKLGGCAPIMANAMGTLGVNVNCVSAFGYPSINEIFKGISDNCSLYSIGEPGCTNALEFDDGKIMLIQREMLNGINWQSIKEMIGIDRLKSFFTTSNVIAFANWTGVINYNEILRGIQEEIIYDFKNKESMIFFDMSDFTERSKEDVLEFIEILNKFANHYKVILGLNENETTLIYNILFPNGNLTDIEPRIKSIYEKLDVDAIVTHTHHASLSCDEKGIFYVKNLYTKKPKISTGGGDNFNAGLCFGQLMGLDIEESMWVANAVSGFYVRNAVSPSIEDLISTLECWDNLDESDNSNIESL